MKKKNYFYSVFAIMMAAVLSVGFSACGGDDAKDEPVKLTASGLDAPFAADASSMSQAQELTITTNSSWVIVGKPDWLDITPITGNGNATVKVWPNQPNTSAENKEATIIIQAGDKSVSKIITQRSGRSAVYARPINIVTLTQSVVFGYEFNQDTHRVIFNLFSKAVANGYTDNDIAKYIEDTPGDWVSKTPEQFKQNGNYFSYTGTNANKEYTLVSVAIDKNNKIGEINRTSFKTKQDDVYNSPYINNDNVNVSYDTTNDQIAYRIQAEKDSKYSAYANKFYSWAIAGTSSFLTLELSAKDADAIIAYLLSLEIKQNPYPHDSNINGSDRSVIRERIEGPIESANYTLPANYGNDKYVQIVNWCTLTTGDFSGKLSVKNYSINSSSAPKLVIMKQEQSDNTTGLRLIQFDPDKLQKELMITRVK